MGGIGSWWSDRLSRTCFGFGCLPTGNVGTRLSESSAGGIEVRCVSGAGLNTDAPRHCARGTSHSCWLPVQSKAEPLDDLAGDLPTDLEATVWYPRFEKPNPCQPTGGTVQKIVTDTRFT